MDSYSLSVVYSGLISAGFGTVAWGERIFSWRAFNLKTSIATYPSKEQGVASFLWHYRHPKTGWDRYLLACSQTCFLKKRWHQLTYTWISGILGLIFLLLLLYW